ncbi:ferrous iron transport protein B [Pseudoflavonifractor phocaeensis]|uniref:ferrous iron transport protein B n=1 Tax=Pseudoflavonifractor phocaeensis TaxID=1870988 RepID=UPI00195C90A2|nr:ferrous iron transport protein B [Pseudoflavonifractor phocaeensis]MBM6939555.1 ferrous iron transport protein B [Pseudoflavonifractor phocaeensis]
MRSERDGKKGTLEGLAPGERGVILRVGNERGPVKRRLVDMGLTPGTEVMVRKIAPFGDPIEVNIRGYELSLRREDARQIVIATGEEAEAASLIRRKRSGMVQHIPDEETLRRMDADHAHEAAEHGGEPDYASHDSREMKLALVGNPNCGKTTLFNALTGSNQYVGNWPGVTVEKKEGRAQVDGKPVTVVDLPGIYSLSPYSMEEIVARDFIVGEHPDAIINIIDATNIERNLYLTAQLLELERPMVIALNFMDEVEKHGDRIEVAALSRGLGVPVIPITARTGKNIQTLLEVAHRQMHVGVTVEPDDLYDGFTHQIHHKMGEIIHDKAYAANIPAHWASIKLLEGDNLVEEGLGLDGGEKRRVEAVCSEYEGAYVLGDRETLIADSRYRFIQSVVSQSVKKGPKADGLTLSDKIDAVVTHKILAVPVFLLMMLAMFAITFGPGQALSDLVDAGISGGVSEWVRGLLAAAGTAPWVESLLVDGIIAGVGGVLVFLPQIAILFFFLSFLEDSGYMSRAAFIMDRLLRRFGLSGKAFIPMLMGFGCTVPAVMGARTMEHEKDRRMTIMLVPFMSCSARLPVYGLMTAAFFARWSGLVVFSLYLLGLICAILSGILLKKLVFKGEPAAFVLELPPYRMPTLKNMALHVWEKVRGFLVKAGTLILAMSVLLWFLKTFGWNGGLTMVTDAEHSFLGGIGGAIAPLLIPLGFGTWQAAVALLTGLIAKEMVVSSMSLFYGFSMSASGATVAAALSGTFADPVAAYAFLVFVLLYVPCVAAVSTIYREMNSLKWTLASIAWQLGAAYLVSFLVYQIGSLLF